MSATVIVPSYRRPADLDGCLTHLAGQSRRPGQVIVVLRESDAASRELVDTRWAGRAELVTVGRPGVVAALNAARAVATGEIVAFTDDDARPRADWLERIEEVFTANPAAGAVGGRDLIHRANGPWLGDEHDVGRLQWFGRVIGNHHLGAGAARRVDVLKGVNLAVRRAALEPIGFDERLRGSGAQVHFELSLCLTLRRAGWLLIYDPQIVVDHYPGVRFDEDQRGTRSGIGVTNAVHNETLILLDHLPRLRRSVFAIWALVIGTRGSPGLAHLLLSVVSGEAQAMRRFGDTMRGRWWGFRSWTMKDSVRP